jgi:hypothetical protein
MPWPGRLYEEARLYWRLKAASSVASRSRASVAGRTGGGGGSSAVLRPGALRSDVSAMSTTGLCRSAVHSSWTVLNCVHGSAATARFVLVLSFMAEGVLLHLAISSCPSASVKGGLVV